MAGQSASRKTLWSWALYDFANSPFTTLVVTFVFSTFFIKEVAESEVQGSVLWSRGTALTALFVALLSPIMGAIADRGGLRKWFLGATTLICILCSLGLYQVMPGQALKGLMLFVIANVAFEMGCVFYNAFLPDITTSKNIGFVSGAGWALGYVGGLLALVFCLFAFVLPDTPYFGVVREGYQHIRITNLVVAAWFALFALPLFIWVPEIRSRVVTIGNPISSGFRQLVGTFREIRRYRQIVRLLVARLFYNDGLITIFAFGGIYAAGTFGFSFQEIMIFGIVLNITAGLGALLLGFMDDRLGGKFTIQLSNFGLFCAALLAVLAPDKTLFWVAGIFVGIFSGPNQSASRSLMARFVPNDKENEFFGLYAFSGKATAFLGSMLFSFATSFFESQRAGIAVVLLLIGVGALILSGLDEADGIAVAKAESGVELP